MKKILGKIITLLGGLLLLAVLIVPDVRSWTSSTLISLVPENTPKALLWIEEASYPITYVLWGIFGMGLLYLGVLRIMAGSWYVWWENLASKGIVESGSRMDVRHGIRFGAEMAGISAFLWIVTSSIPVIPGAVHFRTFAFVPGIVGVVYGRGTGFLAGYFGSVAWGAVTIYWISTHTPLVDGVLVGLMTGWFIAWALRGNRTREELLHYIQNNRLVWFLKSMLVNLVGGLVMAFFVGASLNVTTSGAVTWWVGFFAIGVISDTIPMVIFTTLFTERLLSRVSRWSEVSNF